MTSVSVAAVVLQLMQMDSKRSVACRDNFGFESHSSRRCEAKTRTSGMPDVDTRNFRKFRVIRSVTGC